MNNINPPDILVKILKRKREEVDALCAKRSLSSIMDGSTKYIGNH